MSAFSTVKVGDNLVRFGQVYDVFEVTDTHISFKPHFPTNRNRTLRCRVSLENLDKTPIRKPLTKKGMAELLLALADDSDLEENKLNINTAKASLSVNDPEEFVPVLKQVWWEKHSPDVTLSYTKKSLLDTLLKRLTEEVALVQDWELDQAEQKIRQALKKLVN